MNNHRERLAWAILLISFALCVGLVAGIPLGVRQLWLTARVDQDAALEPQRGTPRLQRRGRGEFIALIAPTWDVPSGTVVTTDGLAQCLLTLYASEEELSAVAAVQVYGDTAMTLASAHSPRFDTSPFVHEVDLEVQAGRVRVSVRPTSRRETQVTIHTPHLTALLHEGSYEIRVHPALSELIVRDGDAVVTLSSGESISLVESQRTVARIGEEPLEALSAERNLLIDGSFRQPLEGNWVSSHDEQQPPEGSIDQIEVAGRPAVRFYRTGVGHAQVGIRQQIIYDVLDFSSLVLHLSVQIRDQSLPGCGSVGSECPLIVRIDYEDIYGADRVWYGGFYSVEPAETDPIYYWHVHIPAQTWFTYDSGNLIGVFDEPPALIKEVSVYASGHSFDVLATELELLAQE